MLHVLYNVQCRFRNYYFLYSVHLTKQNLQYTPVLRHLILLFSGKPKFTKVDYRLIDEVEATCNLVFPLLHTTKFGLKLALIPSELLLALVHLLNHLLYLFNLGTMLILIYCILRVCLKLLYIVIMHSDRSTEQ